MNELAEFASYTPNKEPTPVVVVRLVTEMWDDDRGLNLKKRLIFLRRKCQGFNFLEEDVSMGGIDFVLPTIRNLNKCKDGIYRVEMVNVSRDWESGHVDNWEYELVPVTDDNNQEF